MVRDDIIALDSFVRFSFEHDDYLTKIYNAGGYVLLKQFEHHFKNGRYILDKMIDDKALKLVSLNNHKFVAPTATATKYIRFYDSPKDFSDQAKNTIPAQIFTDKPTRKQLFSSVLKFELILENEKYGKASHLELVREQFTKLYSNLYSTSAEIIAGIESSLMVEKLELDKLELDKLEAKFYLIMSIWEYVIGDKGTRLEIRENYENSKIALEKAIIKSPKQHEFDVCSIKYQFELKFSNLINKVIDEKKVIDDKIAELEKDLADKKNKLVWVMRFVEFMLTKTEDIMDNSKILLYVDSEKSEYTGVNAVQITFDIINFGVTKSVSKYLGILMEFQDLIIHGGVRSSNEQAHLAYRREKERLRRLGEKSNQVEDTTILANSRMSFNNIAFGEARFRIISTSEPQSIKLNKEFTKRKTELEKATRLDHKRTSYEKEMDCMDSAILAEARPT